MQKYGFVFPGQGSQKLGMLRDLATSNDIIEQTFAEASKVLDIDLWEIAQYDSANTLDQTHITQPVLLTASVAIWRLWQAKTNSRPSVVAGHSLGEYSALVCAGVINFADGVKVVHQRGQFMQSAVPAGVGKMAAIVGLEEAKIQEICEQASGDKVVSAANFNSPGQTVIAGDKDAVDIALELCKAAGAKRILPLNVSVPSHCALMKPAAERLEAVLAGVEFKTPEISVVQNASAGIETDTDKIKQNLVKQLYLPVLWVDCVRKMHSEGVRKAVECGPGKVLCGLIKRIEPDLACFGSDGQESCDSAIAEMTG
ncbi:MAG: [acyl-carrier-protein] S-malonyltransferase [Pseudohongiellaceae bacterium]|jgi:[acyl-carrier-protein] S-malonyltransferase